MGAVPAGHPDRQSERFDGMVYVDMESVRLPKGARTFALRVSGDSMIGRQIQDGDLVILEQGLDARHGDIVAALIDGQCTLKTFICRGGRPFLRAENPRYPDLIPAAELVIQGVMRALIRNPPRRA